MDRYTITLKEELTITTIVNAIPQTSMVKVITTDSFVISDGNCFIGSTDTSCIPMSNILGILSNENVKPILNQ